MSLGANDRITELSERLAADERREFEQLGQGLTEPSVGVKKALADFGLTNMLDTDPVKTELPYDTWKTLADGCFADIKAGDASGDETQRDEAQRQLDDLKQQEIHPGHWQRYKSERWPGR